MAERIFRTCLMTAFTFRKKDTRWQLLHYGIICFKSKVKRAKAGTGKIHITSCVRQVNFPTLRHVKTPSDINACLLINLSF